MENIMKGTISMAAAALGAILVLAPMTYAQTGEGEQGGTSSRRAQMMQKLAAACTGKAANDPCSFSRSNGMSVNGTCQTMHDQLLCRPAGMRDHGGVGMGGGGNMGGAPSGGAPSSNQ
jgi:hypothetical protein